MMIMPEQSSQEEGQEPIAVVGIGCHLPGGVKSSTDLWKFLVEECSAQCDVPGSRWNIDAFYHPDPGRPGSMSTRGGYFIEEDIRNFDPSFFGINSIEATHMDPQQRKLLEACYTCFESGGIPIESIAGTNTGCYVGNFMNDYVLMQAKNSDNTHRYSATGMGTTILANRISHVFNLYGPSLTLDTACSSFVYALHMACQALLAGECEGAVVAGVNLIMSPEHHMSTAKAGVLSPTSTCHSFDSSADGYGRADGVGAVYLKRLSEALKDNDPIRTVIRGTAVNANGRTNGITLPSADGQEAVIRKAYARAGLEHTLHETAYVECHGTGTAVGDPIEVEAVSRVFERTSEDPILIGSVKTNMGHSEATSGFTSLVKVALALEKGSIPATIGVRELNPKISRYSGTRVVTQQTAWPATATTQTRRASINSFGYGGANAHVILESAPASASQIQDRAADTASGSRRAFLIPFSAGSSASLHRQIDGLASTDLTEVSMVDLAYTMGVRRSKLSTRAYTLVRPDNLKAEMDPATAVSLGDKTAFKLPLTFVFTGQGAQWAQMGKELCEQFQSFKQSIIELDEVLGALPEAPSWTLLQTILDPIHTSRIKDPGRSQPACTALQIAYVQLLERWGIKAVAAVGHSSGEITAAFASGNLTADEAIIIAYYRGYVVDRMQREGSTKGAMMAVGLGDGDVQREISELGLDQSVVIACINSPESVTVSGDVDGIDQLLKRLQKRQVLARKLNTGGAAYHSHHMSTIGQEYTRLLESRIPKSLACKPRSTCLWVSSVTGVPISRVPLSYWSRNLQSPVRFSDAVQTLLENAKYHMIEIGPHSALQLPLKQIRTSLGKGDSDMQYTAALTRGKDAVDCLLSLVGNLWLNGHNVDFAKVNHIEVDYMSNGVEHFQGTVLTDLPPYPWTYDRMLWSESRQSVEYRNRRYPHHDLLGIKTPAENGVGSTWTNLLKLEHVPWLRDHKVGDTTIFPAAGYIAMAMEAICQAVVFRLQDKPSFELRHVQILKVLPLSEDTGVELFTSLVSMALSGAKKSSKWWEFEITSFQDQVPTIHATGRIAVKATLPQAMLSTLPDHDTDLESLAIRSWYGKFVDVGLNYGRAFQSLQEVSTPRSKRGSLAVATTSLLPVDHNGQKAESEYALHPVTIDALLQTGIIASTSGSLRDLMIHVPVNIEELHIHTPLEFSTDACTIRATAQKAGFSNIIMNAELHDHRGQPICRFVNVHANQFPGAMEFDDVSTREPMLSVVWKPYLELLSSGGLSKYLSSLQDLDPIAAILDLICHQTPNHRILEVDGPPRLTEDICRVLKPNDRFRRCESYTKVELLGDVINHDDYDVVILPSNMESETLATFLKFLRPGVVLIHAASQSIRPVAGCSTVTAETCLGMHIAVSTVNPSSTVNGCNAQDAPVLVVEEACQAAFNDTLIVQLAQDGLRAVERVTLQELTKDHIRPQATIVLTIEVTRNVLSTLTAEEMTQVQLLTDCASKIIWITAGNGLEGNQPDLALAPGLARSIMLEQPTLKMYSVGLGSACLSERELHLMSTLVRKVCSGVVSDTEFMLHENMLHISRWIPEEHMNRMFREREGKVVKRTPLKDSTPCRLGIGAVGQFDSLSFSQVVPRTATELAPGNVEIEVKSIGLNAKDIYVLNGKVETKDAGCKLECAGVVTKIATKGIEKLAVGDRVVVMAPDPFLTHESVPEWACCKLQDDEDFDTAATLTVVYSTATYGLHYRARIQEGESVLIHSAAGGLGIAAIQIAKLAKAKIYATVGSEAKKDYLVKEFGLKREHIFDSRSSDFLPQLLAATDGRGVDIVLNSLTGDLLHDSWRACAPFGRFVEVGKRDIVDAGKLDMAIFAKNVTFTAFDLSHLYETPHLRGTWSKLITEVMSLYRQKKITAVRPLKVFDVSELTLAYRHFAQGSRMGKVAVSLQDPEALIPTIPSEFTTEFSATKTYLMVGCLGGLGRSISKCMVKRGARKFIFLSRSGTNTEAARLMVDDLTSSACEARVCRGDVTVLSDVQAVVDNVQGTIGGVVQAAMGLDESLWTNMSSEQWHTSVRPKVLGSWNLYHALENRTNDLDFFLMTSSITGSVGAAAMGNYSAANSFLDVFARFLRSKRIPGISIGLGMISEIGHLHENPDIEAMHLRKAVRPIDEHELLQIIDLALSQTADDVLSAGHVLTGWEPLDLKTLRKAGLTKHEMPDALNDPRAALLAADYRRRASTVTSTRDSNLAGELAAAIATGESREMVLASALSSITAWFSTLTTLPAERIDVGSSLESFGMDSMLAVEFRTWVFRSFAVDIPIATLLGKGTTLRVVGEYVIEHVAKS